MTDRKKLYDLIVDAENEFHKKYHYAEDSKRIESVVKYLIDHGVTLKQMQKPLTVEETIEKRVVYLEFRHIVLQEPVVMFRAWNEWEDAEIIHYDRFGCQYSNTDCQESEYGKTWRCWAEKPTDEEREAAEWEK